MKVYIFAVFIFPFQGISAFPTQMILDSENSLETCGCYVGDVSNIVCNLKPNIESDQHECFIFFERLQDNNRSQLTCMRRNTFLIIEEKGGPFYNISFVCLATTRMSFDFDGPLPHQTLHLKLIREKRNRDTGLEWVLGGNIPSEAGIAGRYTIKTDDELENVTVLQTSFDVYVKYVNGGPYFQHYGSNLAPIIVNKTTFILPCRVLIQGLDVELIKDGKVFNGFKSYMPKIGFFIEILDENFDPFFGKYLCSPKFSPLDGTISKAVDTVTINVDPRTLRAMTEMYEKLDDEFLNFKLFENQSVCSSWKLDADDYHLVHLRLRNPLELPLKMDCLISGIKCVGKEEANFSKCTEPFRSCKSLAISEGAGIISCFRSNNFITSKTVHEYIFGLNGIIYFDPTYTSIPVDSLLRIQVSGTSGHNICTNVAYNISCAAVSYLIAQPLELSVVFPNQSRLELNSVPENTGFQFVKIASDILRISTQVSLKHGGITSVSCRAAWWNSDSYIEKTAVFKAIACSFPKFVSTQENITLFPGQSYQLECDYESLTRSTIVWEQDGHIITGEGGRILLFSDLTQKSAGVYTCTASNEMGSASKYFTVHVEGSGWSGPLYTFGIPCFLTALFLILCLLLLIYYRKAKAMLSQEEYMEFINGIASTSSAQNEENFDFASTVPYQKEYEILDQDFSMDETKLLGCGAYGMVYQGKLGSIDVAIKTLRRNADISYLRSLISELKVMIYLKNHPHLVNLYGANTKNLRNGSLFVMVEMCYLGDLQSYLRKNRENFQDEFSELAYSNAPRTDNLTNETITTSDLLRWSIQISAAMEYLSSKKVIHGDLAARNVLLQNTQTAKISDFGLSRKLYEYSNYKKQSKEPLPWRHMAIESLKDLIFSTQTDVWAFGVTMWEIFSLGEVPYPGLIWNFDFVRHLENGLRMKRAKFSNEKIYDVTLLCWNYDSAQRPTFVDIKVKLETLLYSLHNDGRVFCPVQSEA